MSTSLVIVAIPEETDRVQKISSEKTPHMTLLYLGDLTPETPAAQIAQFVEHAVQLSEHGPFYLDVKRRGELGADNADVLFFDPRSWNLKWIKQFRGQLLQNEQIRSAYDSAEQFGAPQEWVPHLTLGYPETPAKPLGKDGIDDYPIYSVCFDRISVWLEDSNGPEFFLEWPQRDELDGDPAIAYSNTQKAALAHAIANDLDLEHAGVKGMKWGVRREKLRRGQATALRKRADKLDTSTSIGTKLIYGPKPLRKLQAKLDRKNASKFEKKADKIVKTRGKIMDKAWEKKIYSAPGAVEVHNKMAEHFNDHIDSINSKYKDSDFATTKWHDPSSWTPKEKQYMGEINKLTVEGNRKAVEAVHGTSPSGKQSAKLSDDGEKIIIHETEVKHAADDSTAVAVLHIVRNDAGLVTKLEPLEEEPKTTAEHGEVFVEGLMHGSMELGEAFILEHYGVKGMRWGQRRAAPTAVAPMATSKVPHGNKRKTQVKAEGGQNHPAHEDAIKVAESKVKLKKSGPAALSNKELQDVANRVQLEERVAMLTSSRGKKFVRRQLQNESENLARAGVREGLRRGGPKAAKRGATTAAKIGIGAALL